MAWIWFHSQATSATVGSLGMRLNLHCVGCQLPVCLEGLRFILSFKQVIHSCLKPPSVRHTSLRITITETVHTHTWRGLTWPNCSRRAHITLPPTHTSHTLTLPTPWVTTIDSLASLRVAVTSLASIRIIGAEIEKSLFASITLLPLHIYLTETHPCNETGVRGVIVMETHPALCARCVAVTSCLGKMGDEEGSGGEDGKRWTKEYKIQMVIYLGECLHVASCLHAHYY